MRDVRFDSPTEWWTGRFLTLSAGGAKLARSPTAAIRREGGAMILTSLEKVSFSKGYGHAERELEGAAQRTRGDGRPMPRGVGRLVRGARRWLRPRVLRVCCWQRIGEYADEAGRF